MHKRLYFVVAIALLASLVAPTALAQDGPPTRHHPVETGDAEVQPIEHLMRPLNGTVSVVVHLDKESLARSGAGLNAEGRGTYAASVAALQNDVAAQVNALGGNVVGQPDARSTCRGASGLQGLDGVQDRFFFRTWSGGEDETGGSGIHHDGHPVLGAELIHQHPESGLQ